MAYVTPKEAAQYIGSAAMAEDTLDYWLKNASDSVDSLTFNRIRAVGFDRLTQFQQERVKQVVARLACWQAENQEALSTPLSVFSINGVSAQYATGVGVRAVGEVLIPAHLLSLLEQTGLCCRRL